MVFACAFPFVVFHNTLFPSCLGQAATLRAKQVAKASTAGKKLPRKTKGSVVRHAVYNVFHHTFRKGSSNAAAPVPACVAKATGAAWPDNGTTRSKAVRSYALPDSRMSC